MIIVIDALNRHRFGALLDEMFRLRARVFGDRLGWEVVVTDGREVDRFDALDPAYLVGLDADGHVVSCARLLQTTGPHMLADVFSPILDGEPPLRSPRIWESTRFCVDTVRLKATGGANGISRATCEILLAINDHGMAAGVSDIVTVIDPVMDRVLRRSNCAPYDYVGSPKRMGKAMALAALLDCSEERGRAVRAFSGIAGDVFLADDEALALFARARAAAPEPEPEPEPGPEAESGHGSGRASNVLPFPAPAAPPMPVSTDDILDYCASLIRGADGPEGRRKALALARDLLVRVGLAERIDLLAPAPAPLAPPAPGGRPEPVRS